MADVAYAAGLALYCGTPLFFQEHAHFLLEHARFLLELADLRCLANLGASREFSDFAHLGPLRLTVGAGKNAKSYLNAADSARQSAKRRY